MKTKKTPRVIPVISAVSIQLCCGIAYIWSVFQTGIANSIFKGNNAAASLSFSILLATLTIGSILGGKMKAKYSTRIIVIIGGVIMSGGFLLASFVTSEAPYLLWATYGLMGGVGMGFTYSTTIACAQKWYPEKKGLVTGIIVSALGFGGVVFTPIIEGLIKKFGGVGVGEMKTFMVLSIIFIVVCVVGGLFMKDAPETAPATSANGTASKPMAKEYSPLQVLKMPQFYIITLTLALACMGGLMIIGFAKPIAIAKGFDATTASIGVVIIALCNSLGRLLWGIISDRLGRKLTVTLLLVGSAVCTLIVNLMSGYLIFVVIALIGFFYGGFLSVFPTITSDYFGAKYMATNYGMVLGGFGIGAVLSSFIAGYYKNLAANDISLMLPAFIIAAACAGVGIILMAILKPTKSQVTIETITTTAEATPVADAT